MLRRALLLTTVVIVGASASPAYAKSCDISGKERELGATYVTTLSTRGTSCGKGQGVVKAYNACRGSSRSCTKKVNGFKCSTSVLAESPLQYDAKVTCANGDSKVKFTYTQNT